MITVLITLTVAGADTGPTFDLFSDVDGYLSAFETEVPKASLLAGYTAVVVPNGTETIKIVAHNGVCQHTLSLSITTTTTSTSTSTSTSTTTSTTTEYPGPFEYYTVQGYICDGATCTTNGDIGRIANYPIGTGLTIGNFYADTEAHHIPFYIFEILSIPVDQTSPGWIVNFGSAAGTASCDGYCNA
jgi:hypothetical protein